MLRNVLVLTVVLLSAFAPIVGRTAHLGDPQALFPPNQERVILELAALNTVAPVAPDLSDIPLPEPKPVIVTVDAVDVDKTSIAFGPAFDALVGLFLLAGSTLTGWLAWWKQRLFKAEMDTKQRELLHEGIKNGILYAAEKIRQRVGQGMKVDVGNELVATVGNYMIANSGKVLKYFNLDGDSKNDMEDLVTANAVKMGISMETGKFVGAAG